MMAGNKSAAEAVGSIFSFWKTTSKSPSLASQMQKLADEKKSATNEDYVDFIATNVEAVSDLIKPIIGLVNR